MKKILLLVLAIILLSGLVYGKCYRIELTWDKNSEEDLAGYKMYQGDISGDPSHIALPNIPANANTCVIDANVPIGNSIFFAVTAFNDKGNESDYSNFVEFIAENQPPIAKSQSVITDKDIAVSVILAATDPDQDLLTYSILSSPLNGMISGMTPDVIYTPNKNYVGSDSFIFRANDGTINSDDAIVSIVINDIPPIKPRKLRINRCLPII